MTTATQPTPTPATTGDFRRIPHGLLVESKTNPRTDFDDDDLAELAASIKAQGVLHPIIVRPLGDRFEIVVGARRSRATKLADWTDVPAFVRHLTDEQALEMQIVENLQRRNIKPLEEARGFKQLGAITKMTPGQIAQKVGQSPEYVYARLKLLDATVPVQKALAAGTLKTEHAVILARMSPKDQAEGLARCTDAHSPMTVQRLRQWSKERDDIEKTQARVRDEMAKAKAAGQKVVEITSVDYAEPPRGALKSSQYRIAGKSTCEHLALGFMLEHTWNHGKREWLYEGSSTKVCTAPTTCPVHKDKSASARATTATRRTKTSEQIRYERERQAEKIAETRAIGVTIAKVGRFDDAVQHLLVHTIVAALYWERAKEICRRRDWLEEAEKKKKGTFAYTSRYEDTIEAHLKKMRGTELARFALEVAMVHSDDTRELAFRRYGVNLTKFETQALAELDAKAKEKAAAIRWQAPKAGRIVGIGAKGRKHIIRRREGGYDLTHTGEHGSASGVGAGGSGPHPTLEFAQQVAERQELRYARVQTSAQKTRAKSKTSTKPKKAKAKRKKS